MNNSIAIEHLLLRLRPLNRALRAAVAFQGQAAARLFHPDVTPLCVTEEQVRALLSDIDQLSSGLRQTRRATLTTEEASAEVKLRKLSQASQDQLPLDRLTTALGLSEFEQEAVLLCSAVELDRSYERIYAFILDDLNRRYPCVELLCSLTAETLVERCGRRHGLSPYGKLRRYAVLQPHLEPPTESRQELRLAPGLFAFLTGASRDLSFCDRAEVALPGSWDHALLPADLDPSVIKRSGQSIRDGRIGVLGIWGPRNSERKEAAKAVAVAAGLPLRRWLFTETSSPGRWEQNLAESILTASALGAILWVDTDFLSDSAGESLRATSAVLAGHLAVSRSPVILTGAYPWRPTELLGARPYAQLEIGTPGYDARQTMWERALPEVSKTQRDDLAARFRMNSEEIRAAARMAGTQATLFNNGRIVPISEQLDQACDAITRKQIYRFATVIKPRRGRDDLILPAGLHQQILEIAQFHRAWPRVSEGWGFGRIVTGEGGIKVLFTGQSGTGKTLAAEVIAGELRMTLLKIDLSRVVSKWVGETERNLEQAFSEAEDSNALLFFDEADALFGKRGDVRHGVDRYANLEVSYLLQRLETYFGLVILASNLRDNIDAAFTRRFQIVLNFPRPETVERRRIWELAFPRAAPLEKDIDFDLLARLDMTGASIVNAAQTAALLAIESTNKGSQEGAPVAVITPAHVIQAIARQFKREARLLTASELGSYASLLQEGI
ncbi:MAG TPA: AAA family ATPase [Pyrinomonadaceae bacterium]|nr:AAA family ATPase [Pyrinomonadaceae bacterium]